jgi:hypothetical protein
MQFSMWTYPWDVQDLSADRVAGELRDIGCTTISLATAYHAGRFLQPRSPVRKSYYPEDGTVYFQPRPAFWANQRIQPVVAEAVRAGGDVLAGVTRVVCTSPAGPCVSIILASVCCIPKQ